MTDSIPLLRHGVLRKIVCSKLLAYIKGNMKIYADWHPKRIKNEDQINGLQKDFELDAHGSVEAISSQRTAVFRMPMWHFLRMLLRKWSESWINWRISVFVRISMIVSHSVLKTFLISDLLLE